MLIAVCIATTGRAAILTETLRDVAAQSRGPDRTIVCPARDVDINEADLATLPISVEIVRGNAGLPAQRNALLRAATDADVILFIDDDFLLSPAYLARMERLFKFEPDCVMATGHVLADGATGMGYSVDQGRRIIAAHAEDLETVEPVFNAYGCNMALRWSKLRATSCLFDENLPLYAWAEDVDFSRQAAAYGRLLKSDAMVGVHLAEKKGRVSGIRFGYSQVANQIYLVRKGTLPAAGSLRKVAENFASNAVGSILNREGHIDRRGRLIGNLIAILDVLVGRSAPNRIFDF